MRFVSAFFALALVLTFMLAETAVAAETQRSPAAGKFAIEIEGGDAGWVQPVEGGTATSDVVQERPAIKPVSPQATIPPRAIGTLKPPCLHPPCSAAVTTVHTTGTGLGTKNKAAEPADKPQTVSDTANDPKN